MGCYSESGLLPPGLCPGGHSRTLWDPSLPGFNLCSVRVPFQVQLPAVPPGEMTSFTCGEGREESDVALGEGSVVGPTEIQHQGNPDDRDTVPAGRSSG